MADDKKIDLSHFDNAVKQYDLSGMPEEKGMLESGLRGLEQGATLGFGDEINAALEAAVSPKTYEQALQESRQEFKQAEEANPWTYNIADVVGSFAVPAGGLGAGAKGLSAGKKALKAAGVGALAGGVASLGGTESDKLSKEALTAATKDAAIGGLAMGAVSSVAPAVLKKADQFASEFDYYKYLKHAFGEAKKGKSLRGNVIDPSTGKPVIDPTTKQPISVLESKVKEVGDLGTEVMEKVHGDVAEKGAALGGLRKIEQPIEITGPAQEIKSSLGKMYAPGEAKTEVNKIKTIIDDLLKLSTPETKAMGEAEQFMAQQYGGMPTAPKSIPVQQDKIDTTINELKKIAYDTNTTPTGKQAANEAIEKLTNTLGGQREQSLLKKIDTAKGAYETGVDVKAQLGIPERLGTTQGAREAQYSAANRLSNMIEAYADKGSDARKDLIEALTKLKNSNSPELQEMLKLSDSVDVNQLINRIDKASKDLKVSNMMAATSSIDKAKGGVIGATLGTLQASGKAVPLMAADIAGRTAALPGKAVGKVMSSMGDMYQASPELIKDMADRLAAKGSPYAKQLISIASAPERKRRALLFTLMQQPSFRSEIESTPESRMSLDEVIPKQEK